jgi:hypothetical protein
MPMRLSRPLIGAIALLFVSIASERAKGVSGTEVNGTWTNKHGEFRIWAINPSRLQIEFSGTNDTNTGEANGHALLENDTATFKPDNAEDCRITLQFAHDKLVARQEGDCGFGLNVSAAGTYKRVSSKKPEFEASSENVEKLAGQSLGSFADFAQFREEMNAKAKTDAWKTVVKSLPGDSQSHRVYVKAWIEANVVQRLMHVDSHGDDNESITMYYWRDGQLTSVVQTRTGPATQISDVDHATETYNFANEKLVGWKRTPVEVGDGTVSPNDSGFTDAGKSVLRDSIRLTGAIYKEIGAD